MAQYTHKIIGALVMAVFLTLTSLDLNTHLRMVTLNDRATHVPSQSENHTHTKVAMATSVTHKIRQAIND